MLKRLTKTLTGTKHILIRYQNIHKNTKVSCRTVYFVNHRYDMTY